MAVPVLKTAQKGFDIKVNPDKLTIDSTKNQFKVIAHGSEVFSLNAGNNYSWTKTITHDLGYKPLAMCYAYCSQMKGDGSGMEKLEKFVLVPYSILMGTYPMTACLIASIERTNTQVKFKFYEDTDWKYPGENPQFYALSNMKMRYFVFIDRE
jgi:hypothetical protein